MHLEGNLTQEVGKSFRKILKEEEFLRVKSQYARLSIKEMARFIKLIRSRAQDELVSHFDTLVPTASLMHGNDLIFKEVIASKLAKLYGMSDQSLRLDFFTEISSDDWKLVKESSSVSQTGTIVRANDGIIHFSCEGQQWGILEGMPSNRTHIPVHGNIAVLQTCVAINDKYFPVMCMKLIKRDEIGADGICHPHKVLYCLIRIIKNMMKFFLIVKVTHSLLKMGKNIINTVWAKKILN